MPLEAVDRRPAVARCVRLIDTSVRKTIPVPGTERAIETAAKTAASYGGKALALAKRGTTSKAFKKAAEKAGERAALAAATGAAAGSGTYLANRREDRKQRQLAMDLARQIGGSVSAGTVIAGERYYVVWRGNTPLASFPALPTAAGALEKRPELIDFVGRRLTPKPH